MEYCKLIFFFILLHIIAADDPCELKDNCEECLAADFDCAWCTDRSFPLPLSQRCMKKDNLLKNNCLKTKIIENSEEQEILENEDVHDYRTDQNRALQIQPQKIRLKLVKGRTQQIKLTYRPAQNNPLDLYYLMDLTWSMRDDRETLIGIGEQIANALRSLTENYRLGFGSFADKPTMPMVMPGKEENPCKIEREVCEPTYSFRHHLSLTNNIKDFVRSVNDSKVTGNLDNLEGQLDALMQVIVCVKDIGWNDVARKIVLLATDGLMHFAGDGKLAGVTERNDKKCHLNENGEYEGALLYDYPSLEEIYRELTKRKVNVIFAVTENVAPSYYRTRDLLNKISSVEILQKDSSNILDLIKKGHQTFIEKVQFEETSPPFIKVHFETDCGGKFDKKKQINFCNNIVIGNKIDFLININLEDFPSDGNYFQTVFIEETSLSEKLEIQIEIQKPCPCEDNIYGDEIGRKLCNYRGIFHCGMCVCDKEWAGIDCSCHSQNYTTNRALENQCRKPISNSNGLICSNRGECDCGKCHCQLGFNGKYCECPECDHCDSIKEECHCGKCICKYGWSGSHCNCPDLTETCESPVDKSICTKRGTCTCGKCVCKDSYFGKFCEIGSTSGNVLCEYFEPCVKCHLKEMQNLKSAECDDIDKICSNTEGLPFNYTFTSYKIVTDLKCLIRLPSQVDDDIKCDHYFTYDITTNGFNYLIIQMDNCGPVNYSAIGIGVFICTFILGLIIIIAYRIITYYGDKREYAKFEEATLNSKFEEENPIFRNPVSTYQVPNSNVNEEYNLDVYT